MLHHSRTGFNKFRLLALALLACLSAGCDPRPQTAYDVAQPRTAPVRNIGSFNEALRCMDDMFLTDGKQDIYITTAGIPDATGLIAAGTKEMFITAVSRMSARSHAFRFVDYDPTQVDVQILSELVGLHDNFRAPNYYVRGAITQLDSNVLQSSAAAGVSLPYLDLAGNRNQVVSVVSLDLNVGELVTRQIIPGLSASNSIAVVQSGKGADIGGLIGKAGVSFSVSLDKSEGFHQAVRSLVELSTIEILGKLTHVPYWQCLSLDSTSPGYRSEARTWFDLMGDGERTRYVTTALSSSGYLAGSNANLSDAIARYQSDNDLVANGRIDFELYYRILAGKSRSASPPTGPAAASSPPPPTVAATSTIPPPASPPQLTVSTPRGQHPTYRVGETMVITVQPNQDAYVYCYYQDGAGTIARIFPNRFQPDPLIRQSVSVTVPPAGGQSFDLRFDKAGVTEAVTCLGVDREVGTKLPAALKTQDLDPLPVASVDDIITQFRQIPGAQLASGKVAVEVVR